MKLSRGISFQYFVYILTNNSGTLYVGVTNHLGKRLTEHRLGLLPGFTSKYKIHKLIYFEEYIDPVVASKREIQLKKWRREKKLVLIKRLNPTLKELQVV